MTDGILRDVRRAWRRLRHDAASAGAAVLVVALAVAAVGSVLGIFEAFFLRPLPGVSGQDELVNVHRRAVPSGELERVAAAEHDRLAAARSLSGLAAFTDLGFVFDPGAAGEPATVTAMVVSANYFEVLGTRLERGRPFRPDEDAPGAAPVAVVSHGLWQRHLAGDPAVIGREVRLDGRAVTVVGVAPAGFGGTLIGFPFDLWLPRGAGAAVAPALGLGRAPSPRLFEMVGRLRAGVGRDQAAAELETIDAAQRQTAAAEAPGGERRVIDLRPTSGLDDNLRGGVVAFVSVLAAGALLLLAVAGLNVGGLLLARGVGRERETAIEAALGARRGAILRGHLVETLCLFGAAGALGVWGACGTTALLRRFEPPFEVPLVFDVAPRPGALAAAFVVALAAGLAVGLLPARPGLRRREGAAAVLQGGGRGTTAAALSRALRSVVALQVALSLVLLVAAGLFVRSVGGARAIDPGFEMERRWVFAAGPADSDLAPARRRAWLDGLVERLAAAPGIESVGITTRLPLGLGASTARIEFIPATGEARSLEADSSSIDRGYLAALGLALVAGRGFGTAEGPVVVVNETLARSLSPGDSGPEQALGRVLSVDGEERMVVGVVRDTRVRRLWEAPRPLIHLPLSGAAPRHAVVVVSALERGALVALVRRELRAYDPAVPAAAVRSFAEHAAISFLPQRLAAAVASALGLVCLAVAAAGLYGLFAFWVAARTRELGVRRAVGATHGSLARLVLGQCARQLAVGAAVGVPLALAAGQLLRRQLVAVGPADPASFAAALAVLAVAALAAAALPLWRALRVDPSQALRQE